MGILSLYSPRIYGLLISHVFSDLQEQNIKSYVTVIPSFTNLIDIYWAMMTRQSLCQKQQLQHQPELVPARGTCRAVRQEQKHKLTEHNLAESVVYILIKGVQGALKAYSLAGKKHFQISKWLKRLWPGRVKCPWEGHEKVIYGWGYVLLERRQNPFSLCMSFIFLLRATGNCKGFKWGGDTITFTFHITLALRAFERESARRLRQDHGILDWVMRKYSDKRLNLGDI